MDKETNQAVNCVFNGASEAQVMPRVVMICPTYRKEDANSAHDESYRARYEGLVALYKTFIDQDYPSDKIELRIADSSAIAHPFFANLKDPRVKYLHLPSRSTQTKMALSGISTEASSFLLTDEELSTQDLRSKIQSLQLYCSRKLDPISAEWIPSIPDPLQNPRPSIGMKRNILCSLPFTADSSNLPPDIIIAADDDDWRSNDYTRKIVAALEDADWTKLVNYHLALYMSDRDDFEWGKKEFDLIPHQDGRNLPAVQFSESAIMYKKGEGFKFGEPEEVFNSPRWHPLSTDGAVHGLRHSAWRRAVDLCGGYSPVSYNEDTLMFETLRLLGQLDQLSKIERNARITKGLIGQKVLTAEEIEADKQNGTIRFNPIKTDEFDFLRLCCANVSPVALSATVDKREIPADLLNVFNYVLQRTKQNGLMPGLEGVLNREVK
jgi:hypothetical protein